MINKFSFFDSVNGKMSDNKKIAVRQDKKEVVPFKKYLLKDTVYIRNYNATKVEDQYKGPYVITKIGDKGLWVQVNHEDCWIHVRHLK